MSLSTFEQDLVATLPLLRRRALSLARSAPLADDLVQETALRALRFRDLYREGSSIEAWLLQILRNVFFSRGRKLGRERRALDRYGSDPNVTTAVPSDPSKQMGGLTRTTERALSLLPDAYREVLFRVDVDGESYGEVADALHIPRGTVMSRLHRGRRILRSSLAA